MFQVKIILAEILAALRQLMMHQRWQYLLQLEEETFARGVVVGKHFEAN